VTASGGGLTAPVAITVTVGTINARLNLVLPAGSMHPKATAWVGLLYRDLLGRVPQASEVATWVGGFSSGVSRDAIVAGFLNSREYLTGLVTQWYEQYLHRAPDQSGLNNFVGALQSGASADTIREAILASPEFFAVQGSTTGGFVQALYQDLLGRSPNAQESTPWITSVTAGNLMAVATGFLQSQEFRADEVNTIYATYLRRQADSGGLSHFAGQLNQGADERTIVQGILASAEYFNSSRAILWLRDLYRDALGRSGDKPNELGNLLSELNHTGDRLALAVGFLSAPETETRLITALYQRLLGRQPDSDGLHTYLSLLQSTGHANDVIVQLASSPEYYALRLSNNTQFIRGLYNDLLNRGASVTEIEIWLNKLNTGATRAQVVAGFVAIAEYQQFYINSLFMRYLNRLPSKMEMDQYISQLQAGASDAALAAGILSSAEFFLAAANQ